ncbi:diguanylate cyclase [mine drainage metagenome]|uniref:Diguanylate cyclase n=1 Tax=mine drainage metagenome TaxID=410659 RepID=T0YKV7_9ZZZZ
MRLSFDNSIQNQYDNDQLIVKFAVLLSRTVREADIACRLSNLVFGLILDDTDEDGGAWTAERIQIAQSKYGDDRIVKVSAGVASYPTHGMDPATILSKATEAMEKAVTNSALPGLGLVIVAPQGPSN